MNQQQNTTRDRLRVYIDIDEATAYLLEGASSDESINTTMQGVSAALDRLGAAYLAALEQRGHDVEIVYRFANYMPSPSASGHIVRLEWHDGNGRPGAGYWSEEWLEDDERRDLSDLLGEVFTGAEWVLTNP